MAALQARHAPRLVTRPRSVCTRCSCLPLTPVNPRRPPRRQLPSRRTLCLFPPSCRRSRRTPPRAANRTAGLEMALWGVCMLLKGSTILAVFPEVCSCCANLAGAMRRNKLICRLCWNSMLNSLVLLCGWRCMLGFAQVCFLQTQLASVCMAGSRVCPVLVQH